MQEKITIARPYARAAFEQAREEGELERWSEMLQLLSLVVSNTTMEEIINNPKVSDEKLAEIILDICSDKLTGTGRNFVKLLVDEGRLLHIPQILELFEKHKAEAEGVAKVNVISAYPLEDKQQKNIQQAMAKRLDRKVEITTSVDESLIGGAVIRAGDSVIDASIKGRLKQLSHNFAE